MRQLKKYDHYTRREVHEIFTFDSKFLPSRGTWGLQGIVPIPHRENDFVFFVTLGKVEGDYAFDEGITSDGVLTWQSQPQQKLSDKRIRSFIEHDHQVSNIYLFLRTNSRNLPYTYFGKLAYLSHDFQREQPVHFKWQILDWSFSAEKSKLMGLKLDNTETERDDLMSNSLILTDPPKKLEIKNGEKTQEFQGRHVNFDLKNINNKSIGDLGELLVLQHEKDLLHKNGNPDLVCLVAHISKIEGDGTGYDIRSFDLNANPKYIEVKTTTGGINTPFYLSIREIMFSKLHSNNFFLYRVYNYDKKKNSGSLFIINGDLERALELEPITFKATTRYDG